MSQLRRHASSVRRAGTEADRAIPPGEATARLPMAVLMVQVGVVRMGVPQRRVPVPVRMGLHHRPVVMVLMVFIVDVDVLVLQHPVDMLVLVPFREVQTQAHPISNPATTS